MIGNVKPGAAEVLRELLKDIVKNPEKHGFVASGTVPPWTLEEDNE